jgi:hypothetical protein
MSIKPICDKCNQELNEPGGISWSPPIYINSLERPVYDKYHICVKCWKDLIKWISNKKINKKIGPFNCTCDNIFYIEEDEWFDSWIGGEFVIMCPKCWKEQVWKDKPT